MKKADKADKKKDKKKAKKADSESDSDADEDLGSDAAAEGSDADAGGSHTHKHTLFASSRALVLVLTVRCVACVLSLTPEVDPSLIITTSRRATRKPISYKDMIGSSEDEDD